MPDLSVGRIVSVVERSIFRWSPVLVPARHLRPGPRRLLAIGVAITLACFALFAAGKLFSAGWSVYADHELRSYLIGTSGSLSKVPDILLSTEAGYPGQLSRYRPTTYLLFTLEAIAFGNDPHLLNGARAVWMAAFFAFMSLSLFRFFGAALAVALCAACMVSAYWKYVWIGFGVNEQYIALLAMPFLWASAKVYSSTNASEPSARIAWVTLAVSGILLVGVKENMAIIAPVVALLFWRSWYLDRRIDYRLPVVVVTLALMTSIIAAIIIGVVHHGADFYGNTISPGERFMTVFRGLGYYPFPWLLVIFLTCVGLWIVSRKQRLNFARTCLVLVALQAGLIILCISQVYFYDGWPVATRYEFPGTMFVFASAVIALYALKEYLTERRLKWFLCEFAIAVVLLSYALFDHAGEFRRTASEYVERSQEFTQALNGAIVAAKQDPSRPIVIESASPYDLEPVFSLNRFLISYKVPNPIFLRLQNMETASYPRNAFFSGMIDTLAEISRTGTVDLKRGTGILPGPFLVRYEPIGNLPGRSCLGILLAKAAPSACDVIAKITY